MKTIKNTSRLLLITAGLLLTQSCTSTGNEETMPSPLSLKQIYQDSYFASERETYFRWLDDGSGYTVLESRSEEKVDASEDEVSVKQSDIVFYNVDGSGRKVLVAIENLIPEGKTKPLSIDDYTWSKDGKWVLIYTNSKKVWRSRSRGDYFLLNLASNSLSQVGPESVKIAFATLPEDLQITEDKKAENQHKETPTTPDHPDASRLMFAKFSPDSQRIAYVYKNNIYYQNINNEKVHTLTTDGNDIVINGNFDWVYEEELSIRDGFKWSPDSQKIGYWQLDTSGVKEFVMINNTDSLYPILTKFPYPKAGETNSAVRVGVVHLDNQQTQWVDLGGDNRDRYIPRINWANGNELLIQDVNRPQQVNNLWLFNLAENKPSLIFTDGDEAFIEYYYDAEFINNGRHFIWVSERDGWRHLYRVSVDGKEVVDLTPGEFDIVNMLAYNENTNTVYFIASPDNQGQRYMYKSALDGSMQPARITPAEYEGNNAYILSKDGSNALHKHSDFDTPTTTRTIKVAGHSTVKVLVENQKLKQRLQQQDLPNHAFIQVNAQDGTVLDAYILTPKNLDKNKKYPIIFYVYGEPAASTVQDRWGGLSYLYHAMLVQQGFIVASVDNRGTRTPKGRDWRKSIYKKIGGITAQDQADALDAIAAKYAFVDITRVGVWGHSGGGSSTLSLLFKHADKYHAGAAIAPVPDIGLYDTIYQERYSGHPASDPESYFNTSSVNFVEGFEGKLLLMHGTGDDNVHYQGSERLINELIKHNKQFEFMAYPNRTHGVKEGKNTLIHRQTKMAEFFKRHLLSK
jgi:dipeptidyl-peptidase-4